VSKPVLVVVLVLIAVAALFAVGVGAGVRGGQGTTRDERDSALLDRLGELAGRGADADLASITASCPGLGATPRVLKVTGGCTLTVAKADARIRLLRLKSGDQRLTITAPAPEGDLDDIESDVKARDTVTIAIGRDGTGDRTADHERAPVVVACVGGLGQTCTVEVLNGG
jgi:hypothetical protein